VELHRLAPDFELPDLEGRFHRLCEHRGKIVIINFWSAECPHSARTDGLILGLFERWNGDVDLLPIAANRNESVQMVKQAAKARRIPNVLIDAQHFVADQYEAITTPHIFVLDRQGILRYQGAVDDVTFRRREASQFFLRDVVEELLKGEIPGLSETTAYGCAIVREI
jgi:thiol-disulfide isomerase/thioredoxin